MSITLKRVSAIAASPDSSLACRRRAAARPRWCDVCQRPLESADRRLTANAINAWRHARYCTLLPPRRRLGFLSNRQPNERTPDEDADKRMQVWVLPAGGGEPQRLTDEPLGVEGFQFAKSAARLVLFAPVILHCPRQTA